MPHVLLIKAHYALCSMVTRYAREIYKQGIYYLVLFHWNYNNHTLKHAPRLCEHDIGKWLRRRKLLAAKLKCKPETQRQTERFAEKHKRNLIILWQNSIFSPLEMVHFKVCTIKCVLSYDHDELLFKKKKWHTCIRNIRFLFRL